MSVMICYVYMLLCEGGGIYTGMTQNVTMRYKQHLTGQGANYTKKHRPLRILRTWKCESRSEAAELEKYFKSLTHARKLYAATHNLRYGVPRETNFVGV